ncbi:nuclear transport factor 2 family protein [Nannocystis bainbridge]|uniref:Nuclear transport factor 2 family protein n=1 Tax=Nannocystis bainbridge TaxID=2995303 RepID=A0ABT5EBR1_9BACT|nr:nuclear transport factor 2 family protein [Nannocystis bainbridge]MDC0723297.1 nuclear transport factor 2 family protein [Nannocystis bainbridge]
MVAVSCLSSFAIAPTADAKKGGEDAGKRLSDRAEIVDLGYCYAEATDAIGRGDFATGKETYKECFTANANIAAYFPGSDPNGPPGVAAIGPVAWANAVKGVFDGSGYVSTQHLVSNVRIDLDGNTGTVTSYLHATHVIDPDGAIEVANGTYYDTVVRTPQGWRISKRKLVLIDFVRLESPAP